MPTRPKPQARPLALAVLAALFLGGAARSPTTPAPGPLRVIGRPGDGCIGGAVRLPDHGPGFQTIRADKSSFWGAPQTVAGVERLAARAHAAGLPDLYIGDLSSPRGGPLPGGHVSHEIGVDADIYLDVDPKPALTPAQRDDLVPPSMVRDDQRGIDPLHWSPKVVTLLRLAATLPGVDRVLVNPAIKRQLCRTVTGDRSWLHRIRPWYGHEAHMHVRFDCPPGQTACHEGAPIPPGDGCDKTLQWWFDRLNAPPPPPAKPKPPPPLPAACHAVMAAP